MENLLYSKWNTATAGLSWGVQRVFRDALQLVADGKVTLTYGADYNDGSPCLVNSVAQMLTTGGGNGVPSANFGEVVSLFDRINMELATKGVNTESHRVSPLAGEILLRYFAPLKEPSIEEAVNTATEAEAFANGVFKEPTDADMARDWLNALHVESAMEHDFSKEVESKQDAEA